MIELLALIISFVALAVTLFIAVLQELIRKKAYRSERALHASAKVSQSNIAANIVGRLNILDALLKNNAVLYEIERESLLKTIEAGSEIHDKYWDELMKPPPSLRQTD